MRHKIISGTTLVEKLIEEGVIPQNSTRVVIDIRVDNTVHVFYETLGDERLLNIGFKDGLGGIELTVL